ncbi:MAG: hypothetical protein GY898_06935 [Proteobacteria bacterium]|nr:hypothetical protein [Pseudomonadota bacterium]
MTTLQSLRDVALVARWWLARSVRTRSAGALVLIYTLLLAGGAWMFTKFIHSMELTLANTLRVPPTKKPGAMLDTLKERGELKELLQGMIEDPAAVEWAIQLPVLSTFTFWMGLGAVPFLACAAGAEAISPDIRDRSLRYELVRTGRLELVAGRFLGQAFLVGLGLAFGCAGVWIVAMTGMVDQPPAEQATSLMLFAPRLWVWSLPWLGLGIACSQLSGTVNFTRTLALGGTVGVMIVFGITQWLSDDYWPILGDLVLPILPHSYSLGLWGPGFGWAGEALILAAMGLVWALVTYPLFARRNA